MVLDDYGSHRQTSKVFAFNPTLLPPEALRSLFVCRLDDFNRVVKLLIAEPRGRVPIIVGNRGQGKTMLLLRALIEVQEKPPQEPGWDVAYLGDHASRLGAGDRFWREVERRRRPRGPNPAVIDGVEGSPLKRILAHAESSGRSILIAVEDLHRFHEADLERLLRDIEPHACLRLVGTSSRDFIKSSRSTSSAFVRRSVKLFNLKTLSRADCRLLWEHLTERRLSPAECRAVEILTHGYPRLVSLLAASSGGFGIKHLWKSVLKVADDLSDNLRQNLVELSPQMYLAYYTLVDMRYAVSTTELAQKTGIVPTTLSTVLARLTERGLVGLEEEEEKSKRNRKYRPLASYEGMYHAILEQGPSAEAVADLVAFMHALYRPMEAPGSLTVQEAMQSIDDLTLRVAETAPPPLLRRLSAESAGKKETFRLDTQSARKKLITRVIRHLEEETYPPEIGDAVSEMAANHDLQPLEALTLGMFFLMTEEQDRGLDVLLQAQPAGCVSTIAHVIAAQEYLSRSHPERAIEILDGIDGVESCGLKRRADEVRGRALRAIVHRRADGTDLLESCCRGPGTDISCYLSFAEACSQDNELARLQAALDLDREEGEDRVAATITALGFLQDAESSEAQADFLDLPPEEAVRDAWWGTRHQLTWELDRKCGKNPYSNKALATLLGVCMDRLAPLVRRFSKPNGYKFAAFGRLATQGLEALQGQHDTVALDLLGRALDVSEEPDIISLDILATLLAAYPDALKNLGMRFAARAVDLQPRSDRLRRLALMQARSNQIDTALATISPTWQSRDVVHQDLGHVLRDLCRFAAVAGREKVEAALAGSSALSLLRPVLSALSLHDVDPPRIEPELKNVATDLHGLIEALSNASDPWADQVCDELLGAWLS